MTEERPGSALLWERDEEVAAIERAVDTLCTGRAPHGRLLVLRGEAGIGKTALLTEAHRIAELRGCTVWSARGGETLRSVPYNVVRRLLQPSLLALLPEEAREYLGDWYDITGPALGIARPGDGQPDPGSVCDGLVTAVRRLARREYPLVLLVDDAHWADLETLRWLAELCERLEDTSVLVLVACRTGELGGERAAYLDRVVRAAGPVASLRSLTPQATAGLTRATVGAHADDPFCREVWAVTGGNPYETVELLAKVRDAEIEPVEASAHELRDLNRSARGGGLVSRLDKLGIEATRFAWAAAILGTGITVDLVARLATLQPAVAERCAGILCEARILTTPDPLKRQTMDGELEFTHPLIESAVYNSIPDSLRTAMHGIAAKVVTDSGRGAAAASRHLLQVHPDDDEEVVEQLREAARAHLAVGAPAAARACLERALKEPPTPETHPRVLYELGCATLLTAPAVTIGHLRNALALPGLDVARRVDAVVRLSQALLHNDQVAEAISTVKAEASRHEHGPARLRLQACQFLWQGIHSAGADSPERSRHLAELAAACTGRDDSERALLIVHGFDVMMRGGDADEVVAICDRALVNGRLAPGLGWTDSRWGFELPLMIASIYAYTDRLDRAEALFSEAVREYETAGWSGGHVSLSYGYLGLALRRRGRLREAESTLRESLRLADRVGHRLPLHWTAFCNLVDTLIARGHLDDAMEIAERYEFGAPYASTILLPDARSIRGRLLLAVGRTDEAVEELEAAGRAAAERGHRNHLVAPWATDLARALADRDPERARELAATVRAGAERSGTWTAIGEALRCEAALAPRHRAVELAGRAAKLLEESPCQYEHAAARVEYGELADSVTELRRGLALAESCGADAVADRARTALRSLGADA
ncbi:AAA family ATPase [Streptomyces sp. MJP52]|uniref:ATP-binding protein n=1 Tax=Streptomyces sp. MJP52 TaxID=2940555 RepID=UPI002476D1E6|nr:AAA family ATPase [Streptomyces sp. MJP52]MDH6223373.1 tetratricopeptide (TPR) repeat protein [Streptomyces sp. MJP52]